MLIRILVRKRYFKRNQMSHTRPIRPASAGFLLVENEGFEPSWYPRCKRGKHPKHFHSPHASVTGPPGEDSNLCLPVMGRSSIYIPPGCMRDSFLTPALARRAFSCLQWSLIRYAGSADRNLDKFKADRQKTHPPPITRRYHTIPAQARFSLIQLQVEPFRAALRFFTRSNVVFRLSPGGGSRQQGPVRALIRLLPDTGPVCSPPPRQRIKQHAYKHILCFNSTIHQLIQQVTNLRSNNHAAYTVAYWRLPTLKIALWFQLVTACKLHRQLYTLLNSDNYLTYDLTYAIVHTLTQQWCWRV